MGAQMDPIQLVLSKLPDAKQNGRGWLARCPAHKDQHASLSISEGVTGAALLHCHAGCPFADIVRALHLKPSDLAAVAQHNDATPTARKAARRQGKTYPSCAEAVAALEKQHGPRAQLWTYHDANGEPCGVVVRWNRPDGSKDIRPVARTDDGWIIGAIPTPPAALQLADDSRFGWNEASVHRRGREVCRCPDGARLARNDKRRRSEGGEQERLDATGWPDGTPCLPGSVILVAAEDDPSQVTRPRLDALGADVSRVNILATVRKKGKDGRTHETMFSLANVEALGVALQQTPDCALIVVDPIGSFLGGGIDAHRDNEVRSILAPVASLAEKYGVAVLIVAHRRKSPSSSADDLALGSRAFTGIARAVWHVTTDKDSQTGDGERRLLLPGKCNLASRQPGLAFRIEGEPPAIRWEAGRVNLTADQALAIELDERGKRGPEACGQREAADWLRRLLADGPPPAATVKKQAKDAELAWRTVRRAADALRVKRSKGGFGDGWYWSLPSAAVGIREDVQRHPKDETWTPSEKPGHLRGFDPENAGSAPLKDVVSDEDAQVSLPGHVREQPAPVAG